MNKEELLKKCKIYNNQNIRGIYIIPKNILASKYMNYIVIGHSHYDDNIKDCYYYIMSNEIQVINLIAGIFNKNEIFNLFFEMYKDGIIHIWTTEKNNTKNFDDMLEDIRILSEKNFSITRSKQLKLNHKQLMDINKVAISNSKLIQENRELKEKYLNAVADYETEKYKNSKAIEYIHNNQPVFELSSKEQIQEWFEKEYYVELLNTLKGENDGNNKC